MRRVRGWQVGACFLALAAAGLAAGPTPGGAVRLAAGVRAWIDHLLGPTAPDLPVRAQVDGDHYRLTIPLVGMRAKGTEPALTAAVQEQPDRRWRLLDAHLPSEFGFTSSGTQTEVTIGSQQANGTVDPSLQGPSTIRVEAGDLHTSASGPAQTSEQRIKHATVEANLTPAGDGLLNLSERSSLQDLQSGAIGPGGFSAGMGIRRGRAELALDGIAPDHVGPVLQALVALVLATPPSPSGHTHGLTPELRRVLVKFLAALDGFARSFHLTESAEDLQLALAGIGRAGAAQARISMETTVGAGLLRAGIELAVDRLSIPGVPQPWSLLVPQRLSLRPSISGVPAAALQKLLTAAADQAAADVVHSDLAALFAQGGLTVAIDAVSFALGPAAFSGAGSLLLLSPEEREAQARLTATGFDAFVQQVQQTPAPSQISPILLMVRSLAKRDGDRLVWVVNASRDGGVSVNGTDLSPLIGGQASP